MNLKQEMVDVLAMAYDRGWICTRDGNASLHLNKDPHVWLTPSGVKKYQIKIKDLVQVSLLGEYTISNRPSGELEMHLILQSSSEQRCVLHLHPTNTIAAMYARLDLQKLSEEFPEIYRYTRVGPSVPKVPATSFELAVLTHKALNRSLINELGFDIVGQENHGVCAIGKTPMEAFEHVERLEHICEIVLKGRL